jgi:hypothetical protein
VTADGIKGPDLRLVPSARSQQFARHRGDATYAAATPALLACAISRPSAALTWVSAHAAHTATSSILASAAVPVLSCSTNQNDRSILAAEIALKS